ncbi:methyl-accepting chemotaxis protein [Actinokineospora globicatena]|uniref:methyl-accepting chemotaxis protein n=1 Tax=Actinokineospora globicatena TaxID=103729 RepID=UPI0020A55DE6|nr:methyl-accepting chemotaxis protein [Actinokineospora globicatena]MCP2301547.1 methyl-accepting chemotaxis protein [Actinokineospora globicatena]GLW76801.1 chemotaxis transducer [Actinokineospora globicatena]GLW83634.1 chemotaxis transducer [Actinokineospora globicatena]
MGLSIRFRLLVMAGVGVAALGAMAGVAANATDAQSDATAALARVSAAMSAQWNADMMHDAIRGDVMAAIGAQTAAEVADFGAQEVSEHAETMVAKFDAAAAGAPDDLRAGFAATRPALLDYTSKASDIVTTATSDPAAARALVPAFLDVFSQLEDKLGALDDQLSTAVEQQRADADSVGVTNLTLILLCALAAAVAFVAISAWTIRAIRGPLMTMVRGLKAMAARDLTTRVDLVRRDELGEMAEAINATAVAMGEVLTSMGEGTATLLAAGADLDQVSGRLGTAAAETLARTNEVAESAGRVTSTITEIAAASAQIGSSVDSVARASSDAQSVSAQAVRAAEDTANGVQRLRAASREIDEIVRAITSIAEQTNLLALNATIEAARAGAAGKGFAVVASEVKDLAQETAQATENVKTKISVIQTMTGEAVEAIDSIRAVITQINDGQQGIGTAVDEQTRTTQGITTSVGEVSRTTGQIRESLDGISSSAASTADGAAATQRSAATLTATARQVNDLIGTFSY